MKNLKFVFVLKRMLVCSYLPNYLNDAKHQYTLTNKNTGNSLFFNRAIKV
jgi:hypothetical protein